MTAQDIVKSFAFISLERAELLIKYNDLVMEKNKVTNLTGIKDLQESMIKNIYDSLTVYDKKYFPEQGRILDLGTGAGFPGVVLAILRPDMQVVLMDAIRKKLSFIQEAVELLCLRNVEVVHSRAEDAAIQPVYRDAFDVVTARAVKSLPVISEWALPFVKKGGFFAAMKGPGAETELGESQSILHCMHASVDAVKELTLPSGEQRAILYIKKNGVTPTRFPRKAGEAERHPIK